uniref:Uncharacterized protein n=1 Tax=Ditylum brightwellii TaxID=49249 RepID=A0A7S1Z4R4_9STRA|mmetsp:Transcript_23995/g.35780  ORF Transcript_23995/g.35780 Transcript_23995/m.35780 type:complete len:394 (+) Transcript_23995:259-1440(+)
MNNSSDCSSGSDFEESRRGLHSVEQDTSTSVSATSRFGQSSLQFNNLRNTGHGTEKDAGLPLYSSSATGARLSARQRERLNVLHHREYIEITKRHVIPKVVSLATRLIPAAREEAERLERKISTGNFELPNKADGVSQRSRLKSTGLEEDDIENGLCVDRKDRVVCLPQSAATAACGADFLNESKEDGADIGYVSVEAIAAGLDCDIALMDIEAEALIESIRNVSPSKRYEIKSSSPKSDLSGDADDNHSVSSLGSLDDDDIGGEVRRLSQSMSRLRLDLANANWDSMREDVQRERLGSHDSSSQAPSLEHDNSSRRARALFTTFASQLTSNNKAWQQVDVNNVSGRSNATLYWSIALLWAVAILIAGRIKFISLEDEDIWSEIMDWPLFNSL